MVRLKKIELVGFKSFADQTEIVFDRGVTGIVGPNGCGKSNVADAFRWVMGEQSAKSMRGEKMNDVIFAGTNKRKGATSARVTLTFDNSLGELDLPYVEVAVTRRLTRSGESEYRLNGNVVRMRDIHRLFWDSGLGKDAFAIFEQGRIEEIIHRSPEERRPIFEQAAGIHRYRQQWREAARKLQQTEANLTRVADILAEVEKQMRNLEKQVEEARTFKENKLRLEELEKGILAFRWDVAKKEKEHLTKELKALQEELEQFEGDDAGLVLARSEVAEVEKRIALSTEELYRVRSEKDVKSAHGESNRERLKELEVREEALESEKTVLQETHDAEIEEKEKASKTLDIKRAEKEYHQAQQEIRSAQKEVGRLRASYQEGQKVQLQLVQEAHDVNSQLREAKVRLEGFLDRAQRLESDLENLTEKLAGLDKSSQEKKQAESELEKRVEAHQEKLSNVTDQFDAKTERASRISETLDRLLHEMTRMDARKTILERLKEEQEGLSPATKQLIEAFQLKPLHQLVEATEGYEQALAAVTRPYVQTLVVSSQKQLKEVWVFAEKEGLYDFSLTVSQKSSKRLKSSLANFVKGGEMLSGIAITKGPGEAETVTPDGFYTDARGVIFSPPRGESNTFLREAEIKRLKKQLAKGEIKKEELKAQLAKIDGELATLDNKRKDLDTKHRQLEIELAGATFALERALAEQEAARLEKIRVEKEQTSIRKDQAQLGKSITSFTNKQVASNEKIKMHEKEVRKLDAGLQIALATLRERGEEERQKQGAYQAISSQMNALKGDLNVLRAKREQMIHREKRIVQELADISTRKRELSKSLTGHHQLMQGVEKELTKQDKALATLQKELERKHKGLEKEEKRSVSKLEKQKRLEKSAHKIDITSAQLATTMENTAGEFSERFEMEIAEVPLLASIDEKEVRRLRHLIDQADHVNLASIDEYGAAKERHDQLFGQVEDLQKAKEELQRIIDELDQASRERFQKTYELVRENFHKQFSILFEGGEADLKLIGSKDILEAGIEIVAKPPGKKMRSIKLLSGGEKALTAMALLFAVFEVKPAPFCILDEMDAPLDDANVRRFLRVLEGFMGKTQFILITHNKLSMEVADILYGISMQEKGISKKISIRIKEAEVCV